MGLTGRLGRSALVVLCALSVVVIAGVAVAQTANFVRVKVDTANLRKGPGTEFPVHGKAFENDPLKVVGRKGSWLSVLDFQGVTAWIYAPLTDKRPAVIITVKTANIRSGPGTQHEVVFTAERGVAFRVLDVKDKWLRVEHSDGDRGWILGRLVWGAEAG